MDEEIIDTVYAHTLETGDRVEYNDPEDGRWVIDTITSISDYGDEILIEFEDRDDDEPLSFSPEQKFDLYGYSVQEV